MFCLGVHSLVEAWLSDREPDLGDEWVLSFRRRVEAHATRAPLAPYTGLLQQFCHTYPVTNRVRHRFEDVDPFLATAVAQRIVLFCRKAGLGMSQGQAALMEKITLMGQDLGDKAHLLWEMERSRLELARRMARGEELQCRLGALVGMQRDQD